MLSRKLLAIMELSSDGTAQRFDFFSELANPFLLVFADQAQFSHDVCQMLNVLVFNHQIDSVLSQSLNNGSGHDSLLK